MAAFNPVMSMAPISEAQRPAMRRKSSAQNLLASFKSNPNSSSGGTPPSSFPTGPLPSAGLPYATALPTPTTATMPREWDVQSLQSDGVGSSAGASLQTNGSLPQGTSVDVLRELVKKRIITLTYLRNVHEGRSHWFHTIMITRTELDRTFPNAAMKQRTYRFAVLGMALANQFDVKEPQDLLRGLSNVLSEYELLKEDSDKPKIRLFRGAKGSKRPIGAADYALSSTDPSEAYMSLPHVPFPLDYHQTLLSLLDVLSELYNKISKILGPSPFSGQNMMGPLGLLSPHPGVSYLFSGAESASVAESDGSLWGIAHATMLGSAGGGSSIYSGGPGSPPPSWTSSLGDTVRQIDNKLKKLIALLLKELDDCARAGIKDELASLDPLLRHVSGADEHRDTFEFD